MFEAPFKISIRDDGEFVLAYITPIKQPHPMPGDMVLATVRRSLLPDHPEIFECFKELAGAIATAACKDIIGIAPDWIENRDAPSHHDN